MITIKDVEELVKGFGVHGRPGDAPLSGEEQRWADSIWKFFEEKNHEFVQSEYFRDENAKQAKHGWDRANEMDAAYGKACSALGEARTLLHQLRKMPADRISPSIRVCIEGCLDRMEEYQLDSSPEGITRALSRKCVKMGISFEDGINLLAERA